MDGRILIQIPREVAKLRGLPRFFDAKPCRNKHIGEKYTNRGLCYDCHKARAKANYVRHAEKIKQKTKEYRQGKGRESIQEASKTYYLQNKEKIKARSSEWRKNNLDRKRENNRKWVQENKEKNREIQNDLDRRRRLKDPVFALKSRMRCNVRRYVRQIAGGVKDFSTLDWLGCDWLQFKVHIEAQFTKGMSWENLDKWEIDHIIPASQAKTLDECAALNHFTNLRPMWKVDNLKKSNKLEFLI